MLPKEEASKYPQLVNATIMFADIMNSAQFASVLGVKEYDEFISEFQDIADKTITDFIKEKYGESALNTVAEKSIVGDEAYVIFYSGKENEDIKNIIELALILQREWFKSEFNLKRISEDKSPVHLGIGINYGKVCLHERPTGGTKKKVSASGFKICLTKRVESKSREGRFTKIMATRSIFGRNFVKQLPIYWNKEIIFECKGINEPVSIKEIKLGAYEDPEIISKMISGLDGEMLKKAFCNDPYDLWVGLVLIGFLDVNEKYHDLLDVVNTLIEIEPENEVFFNYKGLAYYKSGNSKEAIQYYDEAIKLKHDNFMAYNNKGIAFDNLVKYEEALECYEKAIEFKFDYPFAYNGKGITLGNLGKYKEALQCFEKAIEFKPDFPFAFYNKGIAFGNLGKYEEALECYKKAIEFKPDYLDAYNNKGVTLGKLGKYEEALQCYKKAIKINPDHFSAYYNLACAYSQMTERDRALLNLKKVCELNEEYKEKAKNDSDFDPIRDDPRFKEIVS